MNPIFAISEPKREEIISMLSRNGAMTAGEIYAAFDISKPAVSQHLKILRDAGLVNVKTDAQRRIYSLNNNGLNMIDDWVQKIKQQMECTADRLEELLANGGDLDKKAGSNK